MLPLALVSRFKDQCVLIAGDTHIDREVYGDVHRLAPEGPVPVLQITSKRSIPGGAANVARNISRLGGRAALYGFFEGDEASREILSELRAEGVQVLSAPPTALPSACRSGDVFSPPTTSSSRSFNGRPSTVTPTR